MEQWTPSQKTAIETRDRTLLVSAGAGSGKTTVLTHRLLQRIAQGESVTDFLVVTFTKASAADLKDKMYRELGKLAAEHPENAHFRRQLYLLPEAHIGTIHSFCGAMVRAHFQLLGLSPNLRIADDQETQLLKAEAVAEAVDAGYDAGSDGFLQMAEIFAGIKNDEPLESVMLDLYDRLRAFADGSAWLCAAGERLTGDADRMKGGLFETEAGKRMQAFLIRQLQELQAEVDSLASRAARSEISERSLLSLGDWQDLLRDLVSAAQSGQQAFLDRFLSGGKSMGIRSFQAPTPEFVKNEREHIKKKLDSLRTLFLLSDPTILEAQFRLTARVTDAIRDLLRDLDERYSAAKREKGILDFNDTEHMFLSLLETDGQETELCRLLRRRFREIYIDEYQDVSPLQDRIFTLLSTGTNRFMVGDVKQSIYRFRNAYPDIFLAYKDAFPLVDGQEQGPEGKVLLRENFRSSRTVLDFTNLLFASLTNGTVYEREYKGEELLFARGEAASDERPVTIMRVPYDNRRNAEVKTTLADARKTEAEYVADQIADLMRSAEWKDRDGSMRKCRYSDFSLLFLALKDKTAPYEEALRARGIPFCVSRDRLFFDQPEIRLALSMLRAIDDPADDISLFGTARSPLFGFTAEEIYRIRKADASGSLIRSFRTFAEDAQADGDPLKEKVIGFLRELEECRLLSEGKPCHTFLWETYVRTGLLYLCGEEGRNHLLMLYENARSFELSGYKGLSGFLASMRIAEEKKIPLPAGSEPAAEDCVLLTTIHKSKGLEYPVVFLCDSGKPLMAGKPSPYRMLREEGIFFPLRDPEERLETETLLYRYAKELEKESEYGETLRKLYVGCTRAREKLYVTGGVTQKKLESGDWNRIQPGSIMEMVCFAAEREAGNPVFVTETLPVGTSPCAAPEEESADAGEQADPSQGSAAGLTNDMRAALCFSYGHRTDLAAKITASELKLRGKQLVSEYKKAQLVHPPVFLSGSGGLTGPEAAYAGTANHAFLQFCDYNLVERDGLEAESERLLNQKLLLPEQVRMLDLDGLDRFFRSPLFARIRSSRNVEREKIFSVQIGAEFIGGEKGEKVVLHGLIDCCFEERDGSITIVDYKTDRVRSARSLADKYRLQLLVYRRAVEEMTGRKVKETLLWSFALDCAVTVDTEGFANAVPLSGGQVDDAE